MASSIKVVLRSKANKDGLYPVAIRITKDRKSTYLYTGYYLDKKYWDKKNNKVKKSYPNSAHLNNLLAKKIAEANQTLISLQTNDKAISSRQIKTEIKNPLSKKTFNDLAKDYINDLEKNNKLTQLSADKPRIKHVIEFSKTEHLLFKEIDEVFLRRFMTHLKTKRKNSKRSIINHLVVVHESLSRSKLV